MSDNREKDKLDLLRVLARVPDQCDELEAQARDILRQAREARDTARYQEVIVPLLPGNRPEAAQYCRRSMSGWRAFEQSARQFQSRIGKSPLGAVTSGNTSTATVGATSLLAEVPLRSEARPTIERAESEYGNSARLDQSFEDVKAEMKRLKLDSGSARYRNPLDLLEDSYLAVRYPLSAQGSGSLALLNLRSAINRSVEELVRRRPVQEEAENRRDRVLSIGRHCGKRGLASAHFDSLATDDGLVNNELSGKGKQAVTAQPDLVRQFIRGAQFLRALLASIDEALLRP